MTYIHLTRRQRRQLQGLHPGLKPPYLTQCLRFINNSPLAFRVRRDALNLGGYLMTSINTEHGQIRPPSSSPP